MDTEILYANIKEYCAQLGISISQLEKELHFGTGTIGKWKQSFPSIEKVIAVAGFFHVSLDEMCGLKKEKEVSKPKFMKGLIQKTLDNEIIWYLCSYHDFMNHKFHPPLHYSDMDEIYGANYKTGSLYIGKKEDALLLYISVEDENCMKQDENIQQLCELWKIIKDKELEIQEKIDEYKKMFFWEQSSIA